MTKPLLCRYFKTSPEIIRLAVMMFVRFPLSLRNVEDLLHERCIDICHETVRFWWNGFGPLFAAEIRRGHIGNGTIVAPSGSAFVFKGLLIKVFISWIILFVKRGAIMGHRSGCVSQL